MKRKQNIDNANRNLAVAIRNLDDAMMNSNAMQRGQLMTAKRQIQNTRELLTDVLNAP